MKQALVKKGFATLEDVPVPVPGENEILVKVAFSCLSPGTERKAITDTTSGSLISAVATNPDRIKKAYDMMRSEGIRATVAKAKGELDLGSPSGYSLSGTVIEIGEKIKGFSVGDRVACAGAENAFHAEYVCIPSLLAIPVPDEVELNQAATVALGAITLQGIRRSGAVIGEYVGVIGLGALGQLTGLLLKSAGCQIIGFDLNPLRLNLAKSLGFDFVFDASEENSQAILSNITQGFGVDAAIITAASMESTPLELATRICRKKGKVVLVGDCGLNLKRKDWYPKELDLLISTSYGPGRYDKQYEDKGQDYPHAYVRWTEQRNMVAYLDRLKSGINVSKLIRKVYPIVEVEKAFQDLTKNDSSAPLILLQYKPQKTIEKRIELTENPLPISDRIRVAIIGPGSFAQSIHLPNLMKQNKYYQIYAIVGRQGHKAKAMAKRFGARYATTEVTEVLQDNNVDLVFITTRHNLHAPLAIQAAKAGKAIFMEKPMATTREQLIELKDILAETRVPFMVGFNRRFSPFILRIKELISNRTGPIMISYRVNTNSLPPHHWVYSAEGGGRLIGEGCHFIDLLHFLVSSDIDSFSAASIHPKHGQLPADDNFQISFKYIDGSLASLFYTSLGAKEFPKEYIEIFIDGQVITLNNFKELKVYGSKYKPIYKKNEAKGLFEELEEFAHYLKGASKPPISVQEAINTTLDTFEIAERIKRNEVE